MSDINTFGQVIDMYKKQGSGSYTACNQVEAYWESLRSGQTLPGRSQIDPRGIEGALSNAFILEAIGAGHGRFRIAGTLLCDVMGMEVRGMPASSLFVPKARDGFAKALTTVLHSPAVLRLTLRGEGKWGQPVLDAKMLLLPLHDDAGQVNRILGCLETLGTIGRAPRRFELMNMETRKLEHRAQREGVDTARPTEPVVDPVREAGFAEHLAPFTNNAPVGNAALRRKPRPSYLKLIRSKD
ncbi:PAS domain-containing protein [Lentibacter algarum]|uniref:PAS domain-containing protein n=1 Tax=Lentibacter algarum TaxID=576131 RepID=UPI001C07D512|nr:PAS domain-containing protein [Lentibacter algarum]MBU2982348.1 PAS domain-containing protein [Lentibacter algarum]